MTARNRSTGSDRGRLPRAGDLLSLVEADLAERCSLTRRDETSAMVTCADGIAFDLTVEIDRRKLMTLQESCAHVIGPAVRGTGLAVIEVHHTGQVRRTGMAARLKGPDDGEAASLRDRLLADERLREACLPLDFTRFRVAAHGGRWHVDLRLMGASHVRTRLPPGGSYVRLAGDQVDALLATVRALHAVLPGWSPDPIALTGASPEGGSSHLPSRRSPNAATRRAAGTDGGSPRPGPAA